MLERRKKQKNIFTFKNFSAVLVLMLSINTLHNSLTIFSLENKLKNSIKINQVSKNFDCNYNENMGTVFCQDNRFTDVKNIEVY
ncbi:hypothetical protein [Psychromonas aquatilis]|uniref:Uncharacterized protein n=1 Tax=Psychromonas aquatilis TaxID=2005072 RepID=A0ABU9GRL1_9GAMM